MDARRALTELRLWLGWVLVRLVLAACAVLAALSFAFGANGRWIGFVAGALWITLGVVAFRRLWHQPDRRH